MFLWFFDMCACVHVLSMVGTQEWNCWIVECAQPQFLLDVRELLSTEACTSLHSQVIQFLAIHLYCKTLKIDANPCGMVGFLYFYSPFSLIIYGPNDLFYILSFGFPLLGNRLILFCPFFCWVVFFGGLQFVCFFKFFNIFQPLGLYQFQFIFSYFVF